MDTQILSNKFPKRFLQIILIGVTHIIALILLERILPGFMYTRISALVIMTVGMALAQSGFWWLFVNFFSRLPYWLYPVVTTFLNGFFIFLLGRFLPGIVIQNISTSIFILAGLTAVNTITGSLFSLGEDSWFDRNVIRGLVKRTGKKCVPKFPVFCFWKLMD